MNLIWKKRVAASFIAVLVTVSFTLPGAQASANAPAFSDVPDGYSAVKAISSLAGKGIVHGTADGAFRPDDAVTRGTAAVWIGKALKLDAPRSLSGFSDVPASSPYASFVYALKEHDIVQGSDGAFYPDAPLTREQMASLLVRAFAFHDNGIQAWLKDEASIAGVHRDDVIKLKQNFITEQQEYHPKDQVTRAQLALFLYRTLARNDAANQGTVSLDDFLKLPEKATFRVSPDGSTLAFLQPWENRMNLFVQKIGETKTVRLTGSKDEDIGSFNWVTNNTIVYPMDRDGDENTHLRAVNKDGTGDRDLTPFARVKATLIDVLPAKEEKDTELLVGMNRRDPKVRDVFAINLAGGDIREKETNPGNVVQWVTDNWGRLRAAVARDGTKTNILYRDKETDAFQTIATTDFQDTFDPIMFTFDDKQLYAFSNVGRDKLALVKYDPAAKKESEVVYANADADVVDIVVSYKKQAIVAVADETDTMQLHALDSDFGQLYKTIRDKLSGRGISLIGSPDRDRLLLHAGSDKTYGSYYFYDRKSDKLEKLADVQPSLDESKLADMKPISFKSRDGLAIHGYLTLPNGAGAERLPVVVLPHGGPWARDSWGYNMEVQLLANRGYAVLQINYRGSTGFGKKFLNAGNKQWGKAMQDDLTDGVEWLVRQGIADSGRIAIFGTSYGGYAALAGVAFTPNLYAAGVDYAGPSSLFTLLNTLPETWEADRSVMYEQVGDPVKDKKLLEEDSPLYHVDQIKAPLLIVQGANDPRVKQVQADQLVEALHKQNVDAPYMLKQKEGHGYRKPDNEKDFYNALLYFLNRYVKEKATS